MDRDFPPWAIHTLFEIRIGSDFFEKKNLFNIRYEFKNRYSNFHAFWPMFEVTILGISLGIGVFKRGEVIEQN